MGTFDDLYAAGEKMGFAKGGRVKDTGNMPAKKDGDSQQEKEAGGRGKLRPGYKKGGYKKGGKKAKTGKQKMAAKGVAKLNSGDKGKKGYKVHSKKPMIGS